MKSPVILNLIFSLILAILAYIVFPSDLLSANETLAIGVLIGGLLIPQIIRLFNSNAIEENTNSGVSTTLYVGNLPYRANEQAVKEHFSAQGKVHSVRLMKDRRTGKRKGYGFVEIDSKSADSAIRNLNDSEFQERTLKVRLAKEKAGDER